VKRKGFFIGAVVFVIIVIVAVVAPNPLRSYVVNEAKASGYLQYTPAEAYDMAKFVCTQCHTVERIKLYCPRCGPPFVALVPHMQTFIDNFRQTKPNLELVNVTQPQAVAIVQVWNALVGNWEADFREQDIIKLIGQYDKLVELYLTPVGKRPIEVALNVRDDLKMGHTSGILDQQRDLGKPENNPGGPPAQALTPDKEKP